MESPDSDNQLIYYTCTHHCIARKIVRQRDLKHDHLVQDVGYHSVDHADGVGVRSPTTREGQIIQAA